MKVFISHSHKDRDFVKRLASDIEKHGAEVWYSGWEMSPGDSLAQRISEGIQDSGVMIVVLSPDSASSPWVEKELSLALVDSLARRSIKVVPVLYKTCEFPSSFHVIGDTLYADFRDDYDSAFRRLLAGLGVRPPRRGIRFHKGSIEALGGRTEQPGAIQVAGWEGLSFLWDYDRLTDVISLHLTLDGRTSDPVLQIPLTKQEIRYVRGYQKKDSWGYYDFFVDGKATQAIVQISFFTSEFEPVSLIWIIDSRRRKAIRFACDYFQGLDDPIFGDSPHRPGEEA